MEVDALERCAMCNRTPVVARLAYHYELAEEKRTKNEGAPIIELSVALCVEHAPAAYKHLKRFFGKRYFQPKWKRAEVTV